MKHCRLFVLLMFAGICIAGCKSGDDDDNGFPGWGSSDDDDDNADASTDTDADGDSDTDSDSDTDGDLRPETESFDINPNEAQDLSASSGVGVSFGADSLETESGGTPSDSATVKLSKYLHQDDPLPSDMPGGFEAEDSDGNTVSMVSYGVMGIEIRDSNGESLNLKQGSQATLTIPTVSYDSPETAPLWHFDEAADIWKEEGTASLQSGSYQGSVSHFSLWNVDGFCNNACITGVVEVDGEPQMGVDVFAETLDSSCEWFTEDSQNGATDITGADGRFTLRGLPGPGTIRIWAEYEGDTVEDTVIIPESGDDCVDSGTLAFGEVDEEQWMTATVDGTAFEATSFSQWLNVSATPPFLVFHGVNGDIDIGIVYPTSEFTGTCVNTAEEYCSGGVNIGMDEYFAGHYAGSATMTITSNDGEWVDGTFSASCPQDGMDGNPEKSISGEFHMLHPDMLP